MAAGSTTPISRQAASVDRDEINAFDALAATWWDADGPMRPLHRLNPVRLGYVRENLCRHFDRSATALDPLAGLSVLDIGCGGGLISEPLARLGARVTGVDAAAKAIEVAIAHADQSGLDIAYRLGDAEALVDEAAQFDAVVALEIIEHVADPDQFLEMLAQLVAPGGAVVLSTLNRTVRSFLEAIVGAEYVLRWLPRGTHHWDKFLRPSELVRPLRQAGIRVTDITGLAYDPIRDDWQLTRRTDVNYLLFGVK